MCSSNERQIIDKLGRKYLALGSRRVVVRLGDQIIIDRRDIRKSRVSLALSEQKVEF